MIRFFVFLLATALVIGGGVWVGHDQGLLSMPSYFYQTLLFLLFGTAILYRYLIKVEKPELFVQLYLIMMAVKLVAYGVYCGVIVTQNKPGATANVTFFLVVYFVFTGVEIGFLFRKISAGDKR